MTGRRFAVGLAAISAFLAFASQNITSPEPQPYQGTVTQITDQQITWIDHPTGSSSTYILNRYTGQLVTRVTDGPPEAIGRVVEYTCQKQQKQF